MTNRKVQFNGEEIRIKPLKNRARTGEVFHGEVCCGRIRKVMKSSGPNSYVITHQDMFEENRCQNIYMAAITLYLLKEKYGPYRNEDASPQ
jgi:hypothetical protein